VNAPLFYLLGLAALFSTLMAVTRRELVHAVVYLVLSFFSLAVIFFMMGAPLVAALEVLIYAGAIMVLFLFIVMMLEMGRPKTTPGPFWKTWGPAALIGVAIIFGSGALFVAEPGTASAPGPVFISPRAFGYALYTKYMLAVEVVSLLLLFALVGALYLGRRE
jgi:NADH-quinone oxidoreductase subunit J